jgi:hypothetical protein
MKLFLEMKFYNIFVHPKLLEELTGNILYFFQLIFLAALAVTMAMVPVNKKPGNFKIIRDGLVV